MKTIEALKEMNNTEFLDKIYQFSYRRCSTSHEAEDLCSDIIVKILISVQKQDEIDNFYAFVWTIAHRVYADFCEQRKKFSEQISLEGTELVIEEKKNEIETLIDDIATQHQLESIRKEIHFLSKAYRDVMVMFYLDEYKVKDIAHILGISETTVKQRLFSARTTIKKEVEIMNTRNLSLKPVEFEIIGIGNPVGNDPREQAMRTFSQNLIYLCKDKAKSVKELADELCVPMLYVEEELEIQCRGQNGTYGMLRKLENGKYITNILLVDYQEYDEANKVFEKHMPEVCRLLKEKLAEKKNKILSFPYLNQQKDMNLILWSLILPITWGFVGKVHKIISEKHFADVKPVSRPYSCVAIAHPKNEMEQMQMAMDFNTYCCDGITANKVAGYESVFFQNIYGPRMDRHFSPFHNISLDKLLLMTLKSVGDLKISDLAKDEKEIAAKAIECGYLRKNGNILEPKMVALEAKNRQAFFDIASEITDDMDNIIEKIAKELAFYMRNHIPKHLMNEYEIYTKVIASLRVDGQLIEHCITEGLLEEPVQRLGTEGMLLVVER